MAKRSNRARRFRFFLLEKILLPIAIVPLRMIVRSWRLDPPDASRQEEFFTFPRVVLFTYHGMFLQLLAYAPLINKRGRRLVVMLTPSLDGRLLAAMLHHFDIDHVMASPGDRDVRGALEFARRIEAGDVGLLAVDGPRGPACVAQPRALDLARAADAQIYLAITSAGRGIRVGSWDCSYLPMPFARTSLRAEQFPSSAAPEALQAAMLRSARDIKSPVVAAALDRA